MLTCDVLIAGGGPAGSSCAWKLRRAGVDVAIIDQASFPRDKVCGGWITPAVLDRLAIDPTDYSHSRILQPITGFRTGAIGDRGVETDYGTPVSFGIRRREFDEYLVRRCGARLFENTPVACIQRAGGEWIVNQSIRARILIGAGGHFCPVAHAMGAAAARESPVVAQETEFVMDPSQRDACRIRAEMPELYFCRDLAGYGWCFRKRDVLNVGLGRADRHRLSQQVTAFIELLKPRIGFDIPAPHGHAYLLYGSSPRRIAGDGWMLIGDAAGLAYPLSGEGILPAIESGLLAADAVIAGSQDYAACIAARFSPRSDWITSLGARIPAGLLAVIAPRLMRSRSFTRQVILDRWFLHTTTPPLVCQPF